MAIIIQGRSIDGTVWLEGLNAWTDSIGFAYRFKSLEQAFLVAEAMRLDNKGRDPDAVIGRITTEEVADAVLNEAHDKVLADEASWEDDSL